ncbi:uncharacterized protein LOC124940346 [Impatiens glandulifera]|uniref:uncharacterized protein LOC124940346 n=1 Tax=Impatiens glandulifera TaxID=253017 RepID=UPI001FB1466E|nr:uncharacterized protein LOC124940346 [Impatiens glandulifera]XP_047336816.1 uncharacterized protein LOC124940346 [Impatiens glandulifera]
MKITVMEAANEQDEQKNDDLLLQQHANNEIPFIYRHIVTIDEKYLRHCLELIYLTASSQQSSWEYSPMSKNTLFSFDLQNPSVESILGSVSSSKTTVLNILKNPLVHDQYIPPPAAIESSSSISSSTSTYSNRTTNGMLHVKWDMGSLRYEFWLDDRKEAEYVAELVKPDQSPGYVYVFRGNQSEIVGRMRVSTSVTFGFKETEFVLFGATDDDNDTIVSKSNTPTRTNQVVNKLKGFSGKFKRGNLDWSRPVVDLSENCFSPNLELAAIVFNERDQDEEKSGWGMKFLKKIKPKETNGSSLDIVVASGTHGGPKGGPLRLVDRWRSSGRCDCGGWDIGCSFKILKTRENNKFGNSSSLDLFIEVSNFTMKLFYNSRLRCNNLNVFFFVSFLGFE